ncbi:MAG: hypothetical protein II183_00045, partial [Elusimicrobiaceae bacterium]|nr:hypothetical protein [Elusimicrobiaceae bacterium]
VALLVVIAIAWFLHQGTSAQIADMRKKAEAQTAEAENREGYLKNKSKYAKLAEQLPPNTEKSFWHPSQVISLKEQLKLPDNSLLNGNEVQTTEGPFILSTVPIKGELTFEQVGRLLEAIENNPSFMRISNLRISRKQGELDKLIVTFNSNTIFIQDKDFPNIVGGKGEK